MSVARTFRFGVELHGPFDGQHVDRHRARGRSARVLARCSCPTTSTKGFGPIAAMASAVAVTTTLKVGSLVFDCDYRHPAVLARELATIDLLSEGRLEVGLGAGWKRLDYDRSGIPMDAPKVRVDRMIEHTQDPQGVVRRRTGHVRRRALPHHRSARDAASAHAGRSADPHRWRPAPRAALRGRDRRHRRRQRVDPLRRDRHRRRARRDARTHRREGRLGARRRGRTASTTSRSTRGSRSPRSPTTPPVWPSSWASCSAPTRRTCSRRRSR